MFGISWMEGSYVEGICEGIETGKIRRCLFAGSKSQAMREFASINYTC